MNKRFLSGRVAVTIMVTVSCLAVTGCKTPGSATEAGAGGQTKRRTVRNRIHGVVCIFDMKPWINADAAGDRDPEGIRFKVFLDGGKRKGVFRKGTFHVDMYRVNRSPGGGVTRELVSDWHYPTTQFTRVAAEILGNGYYLRLRWATKDIAGSEIEIITQFEDVDGNRVRSGTKRFRVPRYVS